MIYLSKSEKETRQIAGKLAVKIMKGPSTQSPRRGSAQVRASVITLEGELGAGKTTFVKGFAKALGIKARIKSPTFNLMKKYELFSSGKTQNTGTKTQIKHPEPEPRRRASTLRDKQARYGAGKTQSTKHKFMIHLDCYRVKDHRDLATLDLKTIFNEPNNIVLIEWPERVSKILPKKLIRIHIDHIDHNKRKIRISNF